MGLQFNSYGTDTFPPQSQNILLKGCLVYGICQKRIGNAKRICEKINCSDLTGQSNSRKYRATIKNMDDKVIINISNLAFFTHPNIITQHWNSIYTDRQNGVNKPPGVICWTSRIKEFICFKQDLLALVITSGLLNNLVKSSQPGLLKTI